MPPAELAVFTLGGTISAHGGRLDAPRLTGAQVLAGATPPDGVDVELTDFRRLPSASLSIKDLAELGARVDQATASGQGVVVVQGTDTIEETAFLLDLVCRQEQPVVVTGAMRRPDAPGADGPANLTAALAVAADPDCRGLGVLVVLADEIHSARHVRKTHTTSVTTFASPGAGPVGRVVEGRPRILLRPATRSVPEPLRLRRPVRVGLVTLTLGEDADLLDGLADRYDGLVVAAFGAGHVPTWWVEPLTALAARLPVVLASRTGAGPVLSDTYRGPGSEHDLLTRGLLSAGFLDPVKSRLLLHALLAEDADRPRIAAAFSGTFIGNG
jgi:L-asparaginase